MTVSIENVTIVKMTKSKTCKSIVFFLFFSKTDLG